MTAKKKKPLKFQGWMDTPNGKKAKVMVTAFTLDDVCTWLTDTFGVTCKTKDTEVKVTKAKKTVVFTFETVKEWDTENQHPDCFTHTLAVIPKLSMQWYSAHETGGEHKVPKGSYPQLWKRPYDWTNKWRIIIDMNLVEQCADLYTMYDIMLHLPSNQPRMDLYTPKVPYDCENTPISTILQYEDLLHTLEGQFVRYFDMIIGGELRHISHNIPDAVINKYLKDKPKAHTRVIEALRTRSGTKSKDEIAGNTDRGLMWAEWLDIRNELGIDALYAARDLYRDHLWGTTFGGEKWALICDCLIRHLEGRDTDIIFVDTCWSLQHNGGTALNKVWQIHPKLEYVLSAKFSGNISTVAKYSSEWVRKTWERRTGGRDTSITRTV